VPGLPVCRTNSMVTAANGCAMAASHRGGKGKGKDKGKGHPKTGHVGPEG